MGLKKIFVLLFLFVSVYSFGQQVQFPTTYGVGYQRTGGDTLLWIPNDTIRPISQLIGRTHLARKGTTVYYWNGSYWTPAGATYTATGPIRLTGTVFSVDTSVALSPSLATNAKAQQLIDSLGGLKLNISDTSNWVTSAYRRTDSVFYVKGGTEYFAYKDSTGGGSSTFSKTVDSIEYIDANQGIPGVTGGMIPDDGIDDTPALQAMLNAAAAYGAQAVTIYIKRPGIYNIDGALQTSVDGIDPKAQLYIPLNRDTTSLKRIKIMGANAPHMLVSGIGGSSSYNYGVVLKSGITAAAGGVPCMLGSSYYNTGIGNFTLVSLDLENLTFVTRTKTGSTHIAPSMTALNLVAVAQVTINNVKVITESAVGSQVSPVGKTTYGIVMPGNNNRGISQIGLVNINGYEYGVKASEHFEADNLFISACSTAVYVDAAAHGIHVNNLSVEACITGVYVFYTNGISIDMYQSEHVTASTWNDFQYDIYFNNTGRATIFRAQPVESGVGPIEFLTTNTLSQLDVCEVSSTARTFFYKGTGKFEDYQSGSVQPDAIRAVSNTAGAAFGIKNINSGGYSGIEYFDNAGTLKTFTGYENTGGNFRFNHLGTGGINFKISSVDKLKINNDGTVTMGDYGAGTNTGTATKWPAFTSAGLLIEKDPPVSSIFRTAGIDSTYFTINGVQYAIKDSTGGGSTPGIDNVLAVGQSLTTIRTINTSSNSLAISGSGDPTVAITNSGAFSTAIQATTSQSSGFAFSFLNSGAGTNSVTEIGQFNIQTTGSAANGIGLRLPAYIETSGNNNRFAGSIDWKWSNATDATRASQVILTGVDSATTDNLLSMGDRITLTESSATTFASTTIPDGRTGGGEIVITISANDAIDFQARTLRFIWSAVNKGGTLTFNNSTPDETVAVSGGTLTATITLVDAGSGVLQFKANAVSSLTQNILRCSYQVSKNF